MTQVVHYYHPYERRNLKEHTESGPFKFFYFCYKYNALRHNGLHNTDQHYIILCNKHGLKHTGNLGDGPYALLCVHMALFKSQTSLYVDNEIELTL